MKQAKAYGRSLARSFRLDNAPSLVTRTPAGIEAAATEISVVAPDHHVTGPVASEDAFMVTLMLRDHPSFACWEDGKPAPPASLRAGDVVFHDLRRDPAILLDKPFQAILFYLPRMVLNAIAEEQGTPHIGDLNYRPGIGVADATIRNLGAVVRTALTQPGKVGRLCADHANLALATYVAQAYGLAATARPLQGGLAPWQERKAKDALVAHLDGALALEDLARECRLSVGHFSRAFRQSTGMAPHQWLLRQRIETAKKLLVDHRMTIAEVAIASGFGSQSHLTRFFSARTGVSPGAWRRCRVQ